MRYTGTYDCPATRCGGRGPGDLTARFAEGLRGREWGRGSEMQPKDRAQPAALTRPDLVERVQRAVARASWPRRIVLVVCAVLFGCPVLAPIAVVHKVRTRLASAYVAMAAVWIIYIVYIYGSRPS